MTTFIPTPEKCDVCQTPLGSIMYDAMTMPRRIWGCLCPSCFTLGPGINKLGVGLGQKYERREDGKFHLIEGGMNT